MNIKHTKCTFNKSVNCCDYTECVAILYHIYVQRCLYNAYKATWEMWIMI